MLYAKLFFRNFAWTLAFGKGELKFDLDERLFLDGFWWVNSSYSKAKLV